MITFPNDMKNSYVTQGAILDRDNRDFIRNALPDNGKLVEAARHSAVSGPPGVGKTYGTIEELRKLGVKYTTIAPGMSDAAMTIKLAYNIYHLADDEELVLVMDDADDVIFKDYASLNRWKIALADAEPDLGLIPTYNHPVSMTNTISSLRKAGKDDIANALEHFQEPDSVGVTIPFDRVRVIILCNLDLEDPTNFNKKMRSAVVPTVDRMNYVRIIADKEKQWGWLAHTLSKTQPFKDYTLTDDVKRDLLNWMYSNWDNLRSTSYRTVQKLAADVINYPSDYESRWEKLCVANKGDKK